MLPNPYPAQRILPLIFVMQPLFFDRLGEALPWVPVGGWAPPPVRARGRSVAHEVQLLAVPAPAQGAGGSTETETVPPKKRGKQKEKDAGQGGGKEPASHVRG